MRRGAAWGSLAVSGYLLAYAGLKLAPVPRGFLPLSAATGLALAVAAWWGMDRYPGLRRSVPAAILLGTLAFFALPYGRWFLGRTHQVAEAGRQLREAVPASATLGGYQAILLSLEIPHFVGDVDNPPGELPTLSEKLRLIRPDYLVATRTDFDALDPDLRGRAQPVTRLPDVPRFPESGLWKMPKP